MSRCEEDALASPITCECKKFKHIYRPQRFPKHTIGSPGGLWYSLDPPFDLLLVMCDVRLLPDDKVAGRQYFSHVCLSFCSQGWGCPCTGSWRQYPPPNLLFSHGLAPPSVRALGQPLQTCSNLFNLDLTVQGCSPGHVHHEAKTVGRRAVGIRLKCLLVVDTWRFRCSGINTVTMCICSSGTVAYSVDTRRSSKRHRL